MIGYHGPWNHSDFADLCEEYYRAAIGSQGSMIKITGGSSVTMINNRIDMILDRDLEVNDDQGNAW